MLDNDAAGEGAENRRNSPDTADDALHFAPLLGRIECADDDERQRIDRPAAETLNCAEQHHHRHTLRGATERRAEHENADADEHEIAAAEEIGEFAEYR